VLINIKEVKATRTKTKSPEKKKKKKKTKRVIIANGQNSFKLRMAHTRTLTL
jgi:hypothetical protein